MSKERLYLFDTTLRCPFARSRVSAHARTNQGVPSRKAAGERS